MIYRIIGSIISLVVCGFLAGLLLHHNTIMRHNMGRDAFLAAQGARFDRDYANPAFVAVDIIACIITLAIFIAVYELIAFVVSKTVKSLDDSQDS